MHDSDKAFADLKKLVIEEYGDTLSDTEIRVIGAYVLGLFDILATPETSKTKKPP